MRWMMTSWTEVAPGWPPGGVAANTLLSFDANCRALPMRMTHREDA